MEKTCIYFHKHAEDPKGWLAFCKQHGLVYGECRYGDLYELFLPPGWKLIECPHDLLKDGRMSYTHLLNAQGKAVAREVWITYKEGKMCHARLTVEILPQSRAVDVEGLTKVNSIGEWWWKDCKRTPEMDYRAACNRLIQRLCSNDILVEIASMSKKPWSGYFKTRWKELRAKVALSMEKGESLYVPVHTADIVHYESAFHTIVARPETIVDPEVGGYLLDGNLLPLLASFWEQVKLLAPMWEKLEHKNLVRPPDMVSKQLVEIKASTVVNNEGQRLVPIGCARLEDTEIPWLE